MSKYAIIHRERGLLEVVDGSRADALRAASDLTDGPVWFDCENGQQLLADYVSGGIPFTAYDIVVIPCEDRSGLLVTTSRG
jgi:hypothetical protein